MIDRLVVLSGHIGAGKTTLADALVVGHDFKLIKTRELLSEELKTSGRLNLQLGGEKLDRRTHGAWLAQALLSKLFALDDPSNVVVDSVRIPEQVDQLRIAFGSRVIHVHLLASEALRRSRYAQRGDAEAFNRVMSNRTESRVDRLAETADIVIDTSRNTADDVTARIASRLGLYGGRAEPLVDVLVGGQYGSEGKGHVASYLARGYQYLVRVGGPNAGHKVCEEDGEIYTFHQLPSGTRRSDAAIILGPGSVLSIEQVLKEVRDCRVDPLRLSIDPNAMIIEKADVREEQKYLVRTIGSTGQGVGIAFARKVRRTAARPRVRLAKDVRQLKPYVREARRILDRAFARGEKIFVEGTQGTGLSLHHGEYPFVTSRDTTVSGCLSEAGIAPSRVRRIILVVRTYPIRVESPDGETSGPMTLELNWAEISRRSGVSRKELEEAERTSTTNRRRRVAEFDWHLFRRAVSLNGPTDIALTFADYLSIDNRDARRFEQLTTETIHLVEELERVAAAHVSLITTRFHPRSIIDRRDWR
ncbi:MAG TPA: adenylosuccinate synthetase [Vicinamibacterales bacterium]|nr:adenylosuccinate synthetase [Vicinamibacterales bacterium]